MAQQGLFGMYDPNAILQQRSEQLGKEAYMASQGGGAYAPLLNAAYRMGDAAGAGIGKLFGLEDPVLKRASLVQDATNAVSQLDIDTSDPKQLYPAMIKELQKRGLSEMALPIMKQYQDALSAESRMKYEDALAKKAAEGYEYKQDMLGNVSVFKNGELIRQVPSQLMGTTQGANLLENLPGGKPGAAKPGVQQIPETQQWVIIDGKIVPNPNYKAK